MIHRKYTNFLNEQTDNEMDDIIEVLDMMQDMPTEQLMNFRDSMKELVSENENINENIIGDYIFKLKDKFKRWVDDKIWNYIINKKKDFYVSLIDKLNIFDLTNFDDILIASPNFKLEALYLAGGMDKAVDIGAGWRNKVESVFETYKIESSDLPEISLGAYGDVNPCRIVDGAYLDMFLANPKKMKKLYEYPLILNPVRKEVDRTKNKDFADAMKNYKTFTQDTPPEDYEPTFSNVKKVLSQTIEPDDEQLVRITDATLLGLNTVAGSGTFGETETLSYMNKPIFLWMTDPGWKLSDFSVWTFPHITKIARTEDEMEIMVKTMIDFATK